MPATQEERKLWKSMKHWLECQGAFVFKHWAGPGSEVGIPDLIGCYKGVFFAVEVKTPESSTPNGTPKQIQCIARINKAGGLAITCNSLDRLSDFFAMVKCLASALDSKEVEKG